MADQIYIGNFSTGLTTNRTAFNIDNDSFPYLYNFYVWRGRVKRKRGTLLLGQLQIQVLLGGANVWSNSPIVLTVTGSPATGNILTSISAPISASIVPGSILLTWNGNTYFDKSDGNLYISPSGVLVKGTINYATGDITINYGGIGSNSLVGTFSYYPGLPVMALADFVPQQVFPIAPLQYPLLLAFDTEYSYQLIDLTSSTPNKSIASFYNTTFYKKSQVPFFWSGADYQQFWTTNYSGALWATNNKPGLNLLYGTYNSGTNSNRIIFMFYTDSARTMPFTNLVLNDILWFNEWEFDQVYSSKMIAPGYAPVPTTKGSTLTISVTSTAGLADGDQVRISGVVGTSNLNGGPYTVLNILGPTSFTIKAAANIVTPWTSGGLVTQIQPSITEINGIVSMVGIGGQYEVTFTSAQFASGTGIVQMLTNTLPGQDGIKFYDGDPTNKTGLPVNSSFGWVNFAPPLTGLQVSIDNISSDLYYLVGALAIVPFKDRLLFFSPYIQSSSSSVIQLQDTVIWSWNGTPYYTISSPNVASMVPLNQTANPIAYYVDQTGAGGYLSAGIPQPIITVGNNEDVLLIGFGGDGRKTRFVYTGNDLNPFLFFSINSELPSQSTFSAIVMDKGMMDIGQYGLTMTDQQSCQRIDLQIPDQIFQIQALQNGAQRVNAIRDYFKEWIYFSFPINTVKYDDNSICRFPLNTLLFNYRDNTWGLLYENFTCHGTFRRSIKKSWNTLGYMSWNLWREPWNSGSNSPQFPSIIAGNPQGYVLIKDDGLGEAFSGTIDTISLSGINNTQITSINHCVAEGDYLYFSNILGPITLNKQIAVVIDTIDANNFVVDLPFDSTPYLGLGNYSRLSQPTLQTKQFPVYWDIGRKVRICAQKYLLDTTTAQQCTLNIYLSQNGNDAWNDPFNAGITNGLEYSRVLYTCPESINLGLTPANVNLQMPNAIKQEQIWHRINTSLIGDSVQLGITLNDTQMRDLQNATAEITLHGIQLTVQPSQILC